MDKFDHEAFLREAGFGGTVLPRRRHDDAAHAEEKVVQPPPRTAPAAPPDPRRPLAGTPVPPELRGALGRPA